jgi:hypothetical protein
MLPNERWREDLREIVRDMRSDLGVGSARVLEGFERLRRRVFVRRGARARVTARRANAEAGAKLLDALLARLPEGAATVRAPRASWVQDRLKQRYGSIPRPVHVGFVRPEAKSGVYIQSADGPSYVSRSREDALDMLAVNIFSGAGPQTVFAKAVAAGIVYNAWIAAVMWQGRIWNYADRCPDLVHTVKFVSDIPASQSLDDPFLLDYALARSFGDFRGSDDFSARGAALAGNLADGVTPELVAGFKRLLLETAAQKDALARVRERVPDALGRVMIGYGRKGSASTGALGYVIGSEEILAAYEVFLKEQGEAERLIRLYPRDFWPLSEDASASPR